MVTYTCSTILHCSAFCPWACLNKNNLTLVHYRNMLYNITLQLFLPRGMPKKSDLTLVHYRNMLYNITL
jgi:hypothetical protein